MKRTLAQEQKLEGKLPKKLKATTTDRLPALLPILPILSEFLAGADLLTTFSSVRTSLRESPFPYCRKLK
jgi:hypothetical protein